MEASEDDGEGGEEGGSENEMWQMLRGEREAEGGQGSPSSPCEVEVAIGTRGRGRHGSGEGYRAGERVRVETNQGSRVKLRSSW